MVTSPTVDENDARDERLLADRDYPTLLATYRQAVVTRLLFRLPYADAQDVAQDVMVHLWRELQAGKRYPVPFRVVVRKRTDWTMRTHFKRLRERAEYPFPEGWDPADTRPEHAVVGDDWVRWLCEQLPEREREVALRRYLQDMEIEQIAEELDMTRNAVDQALFRARKKLRDECESQL